MHGGSQVMAKESRLRYFLWAAPGESPLRTFLWGLAIIAMASPVIPLCNYLGRPNLSSHAWIVAIVLVAAIKASGKMRTQWWFWATMIPIAGAHVLFILRVPWPKWVPSGILIGFAVADLLIIGSVLYVVAKLMGKEALVKESFSGGKRTGS